MNNNLMFDKNSKKPQRVEETPKAKALRDLEMALLNEEYERCAALIVTAQAFGANQEDIKSLLTQAVEFLSELAPKKPSGRLRF